MNKMFTFMRESSISRFFIPFGLVLIIFGIITFVINLNNQDYIRIEATVSNVELLEEEYTDTDGNQVNATYSVTLRYTVDGKEYEQKLDGVSKYNLNEKTTIYYNPKDPTQITQTKNLALPVIIISGGFVFLIYGIVSLVNSVKKHKKMKMQERSWENGK